MASAMRSTISPSWDYLTFETDAAQPSTAIAVQTSSIETESVCPGVEDTDAVLLPPSRSLPASVDQDTTTVTLRGDNYILASTVHLSSDIKKEVENEGPLERNHINLEAIKEEQAEPSENNVCPVCSNRFVGLKLFIAHLENQDCMKSETLDVVSTNVVVNCNDVHNLPQPDSESIPMRADPPSDVRVSDSLYSQMMDKLVHAYLNPIDEALKESKMMGPLNQDLLERQRVHASLTSGIINFLGPIKQTGQESSHLSVSENFPTQAGRRNDTEQSSSKQDKKLLKCPQCPYTTSWSTNLLTHMRRHSGDKPFKCSLCSYACTTKQRLVHHARSNSCEKPNKLLEYSTTIRQGLVQEQKTHDDAEEQSFKCILCSQTFPTKESLIQHQISHTTESSFECPNCSFATNSKTSLIRHLRIHTGEKPFKCSQCPYAGSQHQHLIEHQRTHTGEKPFKCSQCSFSAISKSKVMRHKKTHIIHTQEKPFKCSLCSFTTVQRESLSRHFRRHTGERPYKCSQCPYAASEWKSLVCHQRTHTGEKPYKCSLCSYASAKQGNLVRHMRTHSGEKETIVDIEKLD